MNSIPFRQAYLLTILQVKGLESLDAWRVGRALARRTYRATMQSTFRQHDSLGDQIRRSALSIPANIAEGYTLGTHPQLIRGLRIALGSAAELKEHLELAVELRIASDAQLVAECDRVIAMLIGLLKRLGARVPAGRG